MKINVIERTLNQLAPAGVEYPSVHESCHGGVFIANNQLSASELQQQLSSSDGQR